jgi:hypothetical protein
MTRPSNPRATRAFARGLRLRPGALAAAAVALAPLVYFFPAVAGRLVISPDDGVIFNVPLREAAARIALSGSLPLWNPYVFCGMPLHGAAQGGLLFPLNWFYLAFSTPVATNLMMLSTYSVAALGAYLYARRTDASITGAVVTSLVWQFSAFLVCQIGHTNIAQTAACLPWVLWATDGYGLTGRRSSGALVAALVALQSFVGHQQTFAYALLLVCAYAVVMSRTSVETRGNYLRSLVFVAAGVILSAVQILPTFELLRNSPRADATYDFFTSFSMPRSFVWSLFAPYFSGGGDGRLFRAAYVSPSFFGEYVAYVGLAALMLAALAVVLRRDARTKFWAFVAVVALLLALGRYAPLGLYHLIYYVPVLNLFRVPARHLMEVEFALAVLAGRGVTVLAELRGATVIAERRGAMTLAAGRGDAKTLRRVLVVCACAFLLTCVAVTWARPVDFQLGRQAPVGVMRAPELFLPVAFALLGAWAVWVFARGRRGAGLLLVAVIVLDSAAWGQSSGWRTHSPTFGFELWGEPATVRFLREQESRSGGEPYRILTEDQPFDPSFAVVTPTPGGSWTPTLQPDVYEMYGVENAAGYDGFGLSRYSKLAGDMKVWGELTDPERTLRGESRELDVLNVRYLLTKPMSEATGAARPSSGAASSSSSLPSTASTSSSVFPEATQEFGGLRFAADDLGLPNIGLDARLSFSLPPVEADRVALLTNLSWSVDVPDGTVVAHLRLFSEEGKSYDFDLRAGEHTSEWAYDRADISSKIKHKRAPVATSYKVEDAGGSYEAHSYVSSFALPERATVTGGEITVERLARAPDLTLGVLRVSLVDGAGGETYPLRREWIKKESSSSRAQTSTPPSPSASLQSVKTGARRWRMLGQAGGVAVFENERALPRVWLASEARVLGEDEMLGVIRTGRMPDGSLWEPRRTALVESPPDFQGGGEDASARAELTRREPNRVDVQTASSAPSILVLSENHFPGWRAYVDGSAVETLRVDYGLRGVVLPPGEHRVEFVYRPKSVLFGFVVSLLTLAALLVWSARAVPESLSRRLRFGRPAPRAQELNS